MKSSPVQFTRAVKSKISSGHGRNNCGGTKPFAFSRSPASGSSCGREWPYNGGYILLFFQWKEHLLLAADKKIIDHENSLNAYYTQFLLYGGNLPFWNLPNGSCTKDWHTLSATTLELDDLSVGLDAATMLTLSAENLGFLNFQQELGIEQIPGTSSRGTGGRTLWITRDWWSSDTGAPPVDENQEMNNDQELIGDDPALDFVEESFAPPLLFRRIDWNWPWIMVCSKDTPIIYFPFLRLNYCKDFFPKGEGHLPCTGVAMPLPAHRGRVKQ